MPREFFCSVSLFCLESYSDHSSFPPLFISLNFDTGKDIAVAAIIFNYPIFPTVTQRLHHSEQKPCRQYQQPLLVQPQAINEDEGTFAVVVGAFRLALELLAQ
jgi:hypothetical protein